MTGSASVSKGDHKAYGLRAFKGTYKAHNLLPVDHMAGFRSLQRSNANALTSDSRLRPSLSASSPPRWTCGGGGHRAESSPEEDDWPEVPDRSRRSAATRTASRRQLLLASPAGPQVPALGRRPPRRHQ